jgi:hypothetical protein
MFVLRRGVTVWLWCQSGGGWAWPPGRSTHSTTAAGCTVSEALPLSIVRHTRPAPG